MGTDTRSAADLLALDAARETDRIAGAIRDQVSRVLKRRGVVLGLSGGIDSSVAAALCVRAIGASRVLGLLMPEADSASDTTALGRRVGDHLGIRTVLEDVSATLQAAGCYSRRDAAIKSVVPEYGPGYKSKIVMPVASEGDRYRTFALVVEAPDGSRTQVRLTADAYLAIVAATNFKQRVRKMMEYHYADRFQYAVVGTPNLLEYDQGFFVKNGDGAADLKPIAHLYKTQIYAMARHLGLPEEICASRPTSDTYSLPQGQDEFFFALPCDQVDLALWAHDHRFPHAALAYALGVSGELAERIYRDIEAKRRAGAYLHTPPVLFDTCPPGVATPTLSARGSPHA